MESDIAIDVQGVSKVYRLYDKPFDRLKEAFHPLKKVYHRQFFALQDVSFRARKGEIIGIIGKNGSGKSTLLEIITGVLSPTSGSCESHGTISALLELGAGFNPELTGQENVFFKSSLLGYTSEQVEEKLDEILAFAGIGDFLYQPVKTYSSGMFVRLAFAVAINVNPDILIIDEALSVGDYRFQQKCLRKIREFREDGKTIIFVSHNTFSVIEFCTRAIWLRDGRAYQVGRPSDVCKDYISYMTYGEESEKGSQDVAGADTAAAHRDGSGEGGSFSWSDVKGCSSFGTGAAEIVGVYFGSRESGKRIVSFEGGERVVFCLKIKVNKTIEQPIVGFHLCDIKGVFILGLNTITMKEELASFQAGETKVVEFEFDFPFLRQEHYSFSPAVAEGTQSENVQHHWVHDAYLLKIVSSDAAANLGHYLVIKNDVSIRIS